MNKQEAGNVPYVVNGGFGVYTGCKPQKIADTVFDLFVEPSGRRLHDMSRRAREQSRPQPPHANARDIAVFASRPPVSIKYESNK